jgi:hypothetical protein
VRAFLTALTASVLTLAGCIDTVPTAPDPDAPRLPKRAQDQLPLDVALAGLCPSAGASPEQLDMLAQQGRALVRELRAHPDWIVTKTFYFEEGRPEPTDVTVRQLAEWELDELKSNAEREREETGQQCAPELIRNLEEALE